ncbi:MAG TPA: lanthionine synthetase LanC family protein [Chloroflexia bacterium]|nr:lanthionine synthetase LanC family protein [Chloroflexia bacterium]
MSSYAEQVGEAVKATRIHSPTTFSWLGRKSPLLPANIRGALDSNTTRSYLLYNLQARLYTDFYCRGGTTPARSETNSPPLSGVTPFVEQLSAANTGSGQWADGWEARAVEGDEVVVRKGGVSIWARPGDCQASGGEHLSPGVAMNLRLPSGLIAISPGYYMALGNNRLRGEDAAPLVRFYWNINPEGVASLMHAMTAALNDAGYPFRFKVLNDPARFTRYDTAILYISKDHYSQVAKLLASIYEAVAPHMREGTPALTKRLATGLGVAEDPGHAESFGLHRCNLLAEGLVRAYEQGARSLPDRLAVVEETFSDRGINLDTPYLNPGSEDDYVPLRDMSTTVPYTSLSQTDKDIFLPTARQIGERICDEAIWHEGRCNWIGAQVAPSPGPSGYPHLSYRTLGPDLYDGTAGVALFLAHLYAHTGDALVYRTALGAARHALSCLARPSSEVGPGAYTGWPGALLATVQVGTLLDKPELLEAVARALRKLEPDCGKGHDLDLFSGNAGAIVALLALRDMLPDGPTLESITPLGDDLVAQAEVKPDGFSWPSRHSKGRRNLTGFSHGAAGIGYALLKLFHATGERRYQEAAEMAFQYERYWFDTTESNWPDFREVPGRGQSRKRMQAPYHVLWCHGAPGIALSRLYAYQLLGNDIYREETVVALSTTEAATRDMLKSSTANFSLCHGLAGNAEIADLGRTTLDGHAVGQAELLLKVAAAGIETYANRERHWPCGVQGGETPGLMLGLAGIGLFYLRLHDPAIPSVLML